MVKLNHLSRNRAQMDNSSKYKSDDEFWRIIRLDILRGKQETLRKYRNQSRSSGNFVKKPSTFRLDINLEADHPCTTNFPSVGTSSRRANRRISLKRILLHNSSRHRIYTRDGYKFCQCEYSWKISYDITVKKDTCSFFFYLFIISAQVFQRSYDIFMQTRTCSCKPRNMLQPMRGTDKML